MFPFFSIIIPVYQAENTLVRCVRSVLNQEDQRFEIILVNDGSTDGSGEICDAFVKEDARIRAVHQPNSGVGAARNAGIQLARGEYLLFLDSDDALAVGALSTFAQATEEGAIDVVIGSLSVLENGKEMRCIGSESSIRAGHEIWERICRDSTLFGYAGGKVIRKSIVDENDLSFDTDMRSQEDLDFFLSVYGCSSTFRVIPERAYCYYYAPTNRKPPIRDFIANQMKLLQLAKARASITSEAECCVHRHILSLLYTGLYCAVEENCYPQTLERIMTLEGLGEILRSSSVKGEHGFVARNFAAGRYQWIRNYFVIRNKIRDIFRAIKKR